MFILKLFIKLRLTIETELCKTIIRCYLFLFVLADK